MQNSVHVMLYFIRFENIFQQRLNQPWLRLDWLFKLSKPGRSNDRICQKLREFSNMVKHFITFQAEKNEIFLLVHLFLCVFKLIQDRRELLKRSKENDQNNNDYRNNGDNNGDEKSNQF